MSEQPSPRSSNRARRFVICFFKILQTKHTGCGIRFETIPQTAGVSRDKVKTKSFVIDAMMQWYMVCIVWRSRLLLVITHHIITFIIWLAPRAGKMNQIARCDWLPERARWSHLARSGLPAASRKQNFTKSHIINPLLTKFVRSTWSRWLDIGQVLFLRVYGPRRSRGP